MQNLEVVIGIENHIELKTKTKIFSPGTITFNATPNSKVHPIDMGYPGTLPILNEKAVELALRACKAFSMKIDPLMKFDRKNYYYSDLSKGFQITQQFHPIGKEGYLGIVDINGKEKKIEIERLHLEEDTAKQIINQDEIYLDYNRAGIGLIEVVTKPVFTNAHDVCAYLKKIRETVLFLGVSDAKMNEGSLRCDVNISLRPVGYKELGTKVEIKNLNSINNVERAINFEINRQTQLISTGKEIQQETRRYDDKTRKTVLMRSKGGALDYKYFPEPNIPPIQLEKKWIENIINSNNKLPDQIRKEYFEKFKFKEVELNQLLTEPVNVEFFEASLKYTKKHQLVLNYLNAEIQAFLNEKNLTITQTQLTPENLGNLINKLDKEEISSKQSKTILLEMLKKEISIDEVISKMNIKQITDVKQIKNILEPIFGQNKKLLEEYDNRPERVNKFFMGQLMKETRGQVSPKIGQKIIEELIAKYK
ncbi:Asp-tRNA(Asn)/Glu-tRNA(Gln) amidotransferase subunit GatB [Spiroplasma endosymbiont of Amphibalanus improvisus]|uniref:Asp-tRNA(Asn)/Glu-tRNA(Gln) amidotransferase subunit GatB n=1 Tax=Spiroplasma endosymbiont of Amphibalanus improvisus TaxID=3066327 RepID=UPI00313D9AE8